MNILKLIGLCVQFWCKPCYFFNIFLITAFLAVRPDQSLHCCKTDVNDVIDTITGHPALVATCTTASVIVLYVLVTFLAADSNFYDKNGKPIPPKTFVNKIENKIQNMQKKIGRDFKKDSRKFIAAASIVAIWLSVYLSMYAVNATKKQHTCTEKVMAEEAAKTEELRKKDLQKTEALRVELEAQTVALKKQEAEKTAAVAQVSAVDTEAVKQQAARRFTVKLAKLDVAVQREMALNAEAEQKCKQAIQQCEQEVAAARAATAALEERLGARGFLGELN